MARLLQKDGGPSSNSRHSPHSARLGKTCITDDEDSESDISGSSDSEELQHKTKKDTGKCKISNKVDYGFSSVQPCQMNVTRAGLPQHYGHHQKVTNDRVSVEAVKNVGFMQYFIIISIIGLCLGILGFQVMPSGHHPPHVDELKQTFLDTFQEIRKEFPNQKEGLWPVLSTGIKEVVEKDPSQPSTFLLLHELEEDPTPKCLAIKLSKMATAFLEATDPSPLILKGEELGVNDNLIKDYGILISEQKENVTKHRAVIVYNLHKIPATVAQSFHYFCDEYSPVVEKAVYFFTMSITSNLDNKHSPTSIAESELNKLWQKQLETDKLQPLIVRLTTSVLVIKPEKDLTSSCDT